MAMEQPYGATLCSGLFNTTRSECPPRAAWEPLSSQELQAESFDVVTP